MIAEKTTSIIKDCLFKPEEIVDGKPPEKFVLVEAIMQKWSFHPERLECHRQEVIDLLKLMNPAFLKSGGGGWSFLNMCMDKDDRQWGEHRNMEELIVLAIGLKLGSFQFPRDMWDALPGGMPYVVFDI